VAARGRGGVVEPEVMRQLASNWSENQNLVMRDLWLMAAEICQRLDDILRGEE